MICQKRSGSGHVGPPSYITTDRAVLQLSIDHVGVAGHPTDIGRAPVGVFIAQIENPFGRDVGAYRVSAGGVQNAFGLAGGAGSVEQIQRMFGIQGLGRAIRRKQSPSVRATSDRARPAS